MFDPTDKQPTINHSLDLPIQELAHSYPPQQERVAVSTKDGDNPNLILKGKALAIAFIGLLSAVFLTSLDQTIISPALPVISSRFNALSKIAWLPSAYILSQTTFLLLYGQIMTIYDRKWTFFGAVIIFEIGSLICAVSNSINLLIFGRTIAGLGASGVYVGNVVIVADITTLEQRPKLLGLFGIVLVLASILGPIVGGIFTQHVTWRWVFYINLPLGAITLSAIALTLKSSPTGPLPLSKVAVVERRLDFLRIPHGSVLRPSSVNGSWLYRALTLDWLGASLGFGAVFMLLLAFQWGGITYRWDSSVIIGLLVGCFVTSVVWVWYEWYIGDDHALLPLRFCRNRSVCGSSGSSFFAMLVLFVATYYLPLQFQAVRGDSATASGLRLLPYLLGTVVCAAIAGALVSRIGRYWHVIFLSPAMTSIGFGLMYTFSPTTPDSKIIGYQILASMGTGCLLQNSVIALHANVDQNDIPQATAFQTFFQRLGGIIGVSIAGTIFTNELAKNLDKYAPSAPKALLQASVEAIKLLPKTEQPGAILAYSKSIDSVYLLAIPAGFLGMVSAIFIRNISVKGKKFGSAAAMDNVADENAEKGSSERLNN